MRKYMISLDFVTDLSVDEKAVLSEIGLADFPLHRKETKDKNIWMLESKLDPNLPIADHINYLCSLFDRNGIMMSRKVVERVYLDIGVLYDTMTCTVVLTNSLIEILTTVFPGIDISIVCYPTSEDS